MIFTFSLIDWYAFFLHYCQVRNASKSPYHNFKLSYLGKERKKMYVVYIQHTTTFCCKKDCMLYTYTGESSCGVLLVYSSGWTSTAVKTILSPERAMQQLKLEGLNGWLSSDVCFRTLLPLPKEWTNSHFYGLRTIALNIWVRNKN